MIGYTLINGIVFYESEIGWEIRDTFDIYTRHTRNRYSELLRIHEWIVKQNHHIESLFPEKRCFGSQSEATARQRIILFQAYFQELNTIEGISDEQTFIACFGQLI